jgi:hypothetical protein
MSPRKNLLEIVSNGPWPWEYLSWKKQFKRWMLTREKYKPRGS